MSTKRVSQEIVGVEVKLPAQRLLTQEIVNVEVKLPKQRTLTQILVCVEVFIPYSSRTQAPAVQCI